MKEHPKMIRRKIKTPRIREGSIERNAKRMKDHADQEYQNKLDNVTDAFAHINPLDPARWSKERNTIKYTDGGAGFIKWIEDFKVSIEVYVDSIATYVPLINLSTEKIGRAHV